jgi:hypothetical protein
LPHHTAKAHTNSNFYKYGDPLNSLAFSSNHRKYTWLPYLEKVIEMLLRKNL